MGIQQRMQMRVGSGREKAGVECFTFGPVGSLKKKKKKKSHSNAQFEIFLFTISSLRNLWKL